MEEDKMQKLHRAINSKNNGHLINYNGKPLFIKQPNIIELQVLYQTVLTNKKIIDTIFIWPGKLMEMDFCAT